MCFIGQQNVFADGEETIRRLKGVDINAKQIERVSHHYGEIIEEEDKALVESNIFEHTSQKMPNKYIM
jgi:hypothetical protein